MKTSPEIDQWATAFATAQAKKVTPTKDAKNPHFDSWFLSLAGLLHVAEVFAGEGLAILQQAVMEETGVAVTTRIIHKSGQWVEWEPLVVPLQQRTAHGVGSATTYARRYALGAALAIAAEDDDGNAAAGKAAGVTVEAPGSAPVSIAVAPSSRASVPNAGDSGASPSRPMSKAPIYSAETSPSPMPPTALTIKKVESPWEGAKGMQKGFVVLSDGRELPFYNEKLKALAEQLCQDGVAVDVIEKISASGKAYLSSVCRAELTEPVSDMLTHDDIPF